MIATVDKKAIHESFRMWQTAEESLDTQLAESLAALEAYQAHLDNWHQQLVREREALRLAREENEQSPAVPTAGGRMASNVNAELKAAHQQIATLKEELNKSEKSRADLAADLAHTRKDRNSVGNLSREAGRTSDASTLPPVGTKDRARLASPVLGSIVEQFGKLRQQRALDRQSGKQPGRTKE